MRRAPRRDCPAGIPPWPLGSAQRLLYLDGASASPAERGSRTRGEASARVPPRRTRLGGAPAARSAPHREAAAPLPFPRRRGHGVRAAAPRGGARPVPGAAPAVRGGRRVGGRRGGAQRRQQRRVGALVRLLPGRCPAAARRAGGGGEAAAGGQRPRAGPDAEREHGLHGAAHPHPHRARGQEAVQDRDAAPGVQLHRAPGQRAAPGRRRRRRAALLPRPVRGQGRRDGAGQAAAQHLHLLPQQPEEGGHPPGSGRGQLPEGQRREPPQGAAEMRRSRDNRLSEKPRWA